MNKYKSLNNTTANYSPLTPLTLLQRSARVYPEKLAVIDDDMNLSYRGLYSRCRRMASALSRRGIEKIGRASCRERV